MNSAQNKKCRIGVPILHFFLTNLRKDIHELLGKKTKDLLSNSQIKLQSFTPSEIKNVKNCIKDIIDADESKSKENIEKYKDWLD